ncbi:MAG: hypothetical protein ACLTXT_02925 [Ruminococcus callidus]
MPVISIDTLGNSVNTKESYTDAKITIWDENGTIDTEDASISIRPVKQHTESGQEKLSFQVSEKVQSAASGRWFCKVVESGCQLL